MLGNYDRSYFSSAVPILDRPEERPQSLRVRGFRCPRWFQSSIAPKSDRNIDASVAETVLNVPILDRPEERPQSSVNMDAE